MTRTLALAAALLATWGAPRVARAQSDVEIYSQDSDLTYRVWVVDQAGHPGQCVLPAPGWCRFNLSPGDLRLSVQNNGRSLDTLLTIPPGDSAVKLQHHSAAMGWIGLGLIGEGALDLIASIAYVTIEASPSTAFNNSAVRAETVSFGVLLGIASVGVVIAGAVLTGVGFHRAGTKVDLTSMGEVPAYMGATPPASQPPAIEPQPDTSPPAPPDAIPPPPTPEAPRSDL